MTLPNRNNIIARMRKQGRTIPEIARTIGCGESYIKSRLRALGYAKAIAAPGIWGMSENDRRRAIAKRAAEAATVALSTQFTGPSPPP